MKGKEHRLLKKRNAKAGRPGRPYRPSKTSDWLLAVPMALVGKAETFTPADWVLAPHGPELEWSAASRINRAWNWDLTDHSSDRSAILRLIARSPRYGGVEWAIREMPSAGVWRDEWVMFHTNTGCSRGRACPEAIRWADMWDRPLTDVHTDPARCPMALLEPGTWRRVAQFTH